MPSADKVLRDVEFNLESDDSNKDIYDGAEFETETQITKFKQTERIKSRKPCCHELDTKILDNDSQDKL